MSFILKRLVSLSLPTIQRTSLFPITFLRSPNIILRRSLLTNTKLRIINSFDESNAILQKFSKEFFELQETAKTNFKQIDNVDRFKYLENVISLHQRIEANINEINDLNSLISSNDDKESDKELAEMAASDLESLLAKQDELKSEFLNSLIPDIEEDRNNAIIEVNAGVGGQESMLFAKELFEMYSAYAQYRNWSFEQTNYEESDIGGLRHASAVMSGSDVFKLMKYESGVHRVQRVPKTEKSGRVHTSTATVAILPKPDEINIELNAKDLKFEACRSQGPGGQHVNKTESAARITHLPTGIVVFCQDERQQLQNRKRALENLKFKLYKMQYEEMVTQKNTTKRSLVGDAARSDRIRTYNYLQDRVSDHRIGENMHGIDNFLQGTEKLDELITSLYYEDKIKALKDLISE